MEPVEIETSTKSSLRDTLIKTVLTTMVGIVTTKVVENAYDKIVAKRNNTQPEN